MIGFWDYTVILTYISLVSAVSGIFCALSSHIEYAVFFLALSGFCDMFDGKIARTKKNRTEEEKSFGIQIDSLCDMVCFGIIPIMICFQIGMNHIYSMIILALYGLAGLIRLAYFNVVEEKRQNQTDDARKYYQGLPITSMAMLLPVLFVSSPLFPNQTLFMAALHILVAAVGILFITDFKFKKPTTLQIFLIVVAIAVAVLALLFVENSSWRFFHLTGR